MNTFNFNNNIGDSKSTKATLAELKKNNADFEWYPTTDLMIEQVKTDLTNAFEIGCRLTLLDIGFGDGRVLKQLGSIEVDSFGGKTKLFSKLKGIEKSSVHVANMSPSITFVGSDVYQTSLMNIKSDVIFCNPPYSEFEQWAVKIINESFASVVYLVLPKRWSSSSKISHALQRRGLNATVIYQGDFLNADRQARADIEIIRVIPHANEITEDYHGLRYYNDKKKEKYLNSSFFFRENSADPFNVWFNETFKNLSGCSDEIFCKYSKNKQQYEKTKELFKSHNHIDDIVDFYNKDLQKLLDNFKKLNELDAGLFNLLDINLETIKQILKEQAEILKRSYWNNFLRNYEPITSRLTSDFIRKLQENLLFGAKNLDFNRENCFSVTQLIIKEANSMSSDMVEWFFDKLSESEALIAYKSNQKVFKKNDWRYLKEEMKHYKLDYRIVQKSFLHVSNYGNIVKAKLATAIQDILVIANILGIKGALAIDVDSLLNKQGWRFGNKISVGYTNGMTNKYVEIFDIKFFKNGNQHIRLSKEFALKLNIMIGKLRGWVTSVDDAIYEMDIGSEEQAQAKDYFDSVYNQLQIVNMSHINSIDFKEAS